MTLRLKHDGRRLYAAVDCPLICVGGEECFLLLGAAGSTAGAPGPNDAQLEFSPFSQTRLPWTESRGDGRSWTPVEAPSGWTASGSARETDRLQVEFTVSLDRLVSGEHPEVRLAVMVAGTREQILPASANLYTPSSWLSLRLAGTVTPGGGEKDPDPLLDLKDKLKKAKEARKAFASARTRQEEVLKHKDPPKTQAEALALRQGIEAAVQGFSKAIALEPENPILPFSRAELYYSLGDAESACRDFALARRIAPGISRLAEPYCEACLHANRYAEALAAAEEEVRRRPERPSTLILRGQLRTTLQDFDGAVSDLEKAAAFPMDSKQGQTVDALLAEAKALKAAWDDELAARKRDDAKGDLPRAEIITAKGKILVELFEDDAPNTVASFVKLADAGFFDGLMFHRVIGDFMAQGGDPLSKDPNDPRIGSGGPGYKIKTQVSARRHWRGTLSMANAGRDTDGSQFFIAVKPLPHLDGKHAVFGRVLEGQEAADRLQMGDLIKSVRILRKRKHPYEPETMPLGR